MARTYQYFQNPSVGNNPDRIENYSADGLVLGKWLSSMTYLPAVFRNAVNIDSVEGLGHPEGAVNAQKAPYQQGETFLGYFSKPRIITMNCSITKRSLADIKAIKDIISRQLSPYSSLYSQTIAYDVTQFNGGLPYLKITDDTGTYYIDCIPQALTFANKLSTEGFQRFQLQFYCPDPFFYENVSINLSSFSWTYASGKYSGNYDLNDPLMQKSSGMFCTLYYAGYAGAYYPTRIFLQTYSYNYSVLGNFLFDNQLQAAAQVGSPFQFITYLNTFQGRKGMWSNNGQTNNLGNITIQKGNWPFVFPPSSGFGHDYVCRIHIEFTQTNVAGQTPTGTIQYKRYRLGI